MTELGHGRRFLCCDLILRSRLSLGESCQDMTQPGCDRVGDSALGMRRLFPGRARYTVLCAQQEDLGARNAVSWAREIAPGRTHDTELCAQVLHATGLHMQSRHYVVTENSLLRQTCPVVRIGKKN